MRRRFVQIDGVLHEITDGYAPSAPTGPMVMPDIRPYKSMLTGEMVNSRSRHRELLRAHGCIEVGNETKYLKPKPITTPAGLKRTLVDIFNSKT